MDHSPDISPSSSLTPEDLEYFTELQEIEKLIPCGSILSMMAECSPPPQSWFDEGDDHESCYHS